MEIIESKKSLCIFANKKILTMKNLLFVFLLLFFMISCKNNSQTNYRGHTNDTITLSLYGVKLGDHVNSIYDKFPNLYFVNLDSLSWFLPLQDEIGEVYRDLGAYILAADTSFVVDHRLRDKPYYHNGSPIDFPYDFSQHATIITFIILNDHVFQLELFVDGANDADYGGYFPTSQWGYTSVQMLKHKYGECDSIMYASEKGDISIAISTNASESEHKKAEDIVGYNYDFAYLWQWKNAQIIAEFNYDKFDHSRWMTWLIYKVFRVIYTDLDAVNKIEEREKLEKLEEEKRIEEEKQDYQEKLHDNLNSQDF